MFPSSRSLSSFGALACAAVVIAAACKRGTAANDKAAETKARVAPACPTCVVADDEGFNPSHLTVTEGAAGETRSLTFTRVSDDTCATDVVFPELGIKQPLPLNQAVTVNVPVDKKKTFTFQCGMGMYKSALVVD